MAKARKKAQSFRSVDQAGKDSLKEEDLARGAMEYLFPDVNIRHAKLTLLSPVENAVVDRNDGSSPLRFERTRDSLYEIRLPGRNNRTVIGLEMQTDADASMPLRSMMYDAIDLDSQKRTIASRHKKAKDLKADEYIRGFSRRDKVMPVITGVINLGLKRIPESLKDVMHETSFSRYVLYDKVHYVVNVWEMSEEALNRMEDSAKHFYYLLKYAGDRKFGEYINANKAYFESVPERRYDLICDILNMPGLKDIKKKIQTVKGGYDMCRGLELYVKEQTRQKDAALRQKDKKIEDLTKEARKTFVKTAKRYGASLENVIADYAAEYHVAQNAAKKEVMAFWPLS